MSEIADFETVDLPPEYYDQIKTAARSGYARFDGERMSSSGMLEALAKDPKKHSEKWKRVLLAQGVGLAGIGPAFGVLMMTGPAAPFVALGAMIATPFFGDNRACTIVIGNDTEGDLVFDEPYIDCGIQVGRPAIVDRNWDTGAVVKTSPNVIPGRKYFDPDSEDMVYGAKYSDARQSGVGAFRFEKNLSKLIGFYGTGGAISFRSTASDVSKTFALAWLVPERGKNYFAVTGDLGYYKSLKRFYEKTVESDRSIKKSTRGSGKGKIYAKMVQRGYPDNGDDHDVCMTVRVRPV